METDARHALLGIALLQVKVATIGWLGRALVTLASSGEPTFALRNLSIGHTMSGEFETRQRLALALHSSLRTTKTSIPAYFWSNLD